MTIVQLTSYEAFVAPLTYHRQAALFLQHAGSDLPSRAAAVLDELRQHHPDYHAQLSGMISDLGQRLAAEGQGHDAAVSYLQSHRQFLADREALFSGTSPVAFPALTEEIPNWLQIKHAPVHGCFDQFRSLLNAYEHDLYSADKTLRDFEDLIWKAINNPDSLRVHADWSGNPLADGAADIVNFGADHVVNDPVELALTFVRDHEADIRNLIDSVRRGVESVLLPLVDGEKLQDLIDYVAALHYAYQHHVSDPFTPTTHAFATSYQPPRGESSYHDSLASVSQQQTYTGEALATLLTQLRNLQTLNEQKTVGQISLITVVGVALGAMVVALAVVTIPASLGVGLGDVGIIGGILTGLEAIWESIAAAFVAIGAALASVPAWVWVVTAIAAATTAVVAIHAGDTTTATTSATIHHVSITHIGGGASNGGQTVVVNGDGAGADAGGWDDVVQKDLAWEAARACAKARNDHLRKTKGKDDKINYAEGYLSLNGAMPPEPYGPILGRGPQDTHSEQVIVNYWAQQRIPQLRPLMKPGSHLILMIFTRNQMCPGCSGMIPVWNQQLAAAAGPGITIHFYLWQSINPYDPFGPGNLMPVPVI